MQPSRTHRSFALGRKTSIAKTKPRRSKVGRTKPIVLLPPDSWGTSDEALYGPATAYLPTDRAWNGPATADYNPVALDQRDDDAQSLSHVISVRDTEDASTQRDDEEMVIRRKPPHTVKELPLSTEAPIQPKPAKGVKKTIRDMLPSDKVYGTSGQLTADDLDKIDNAVPSVQSLSTNAHLKCAAVQLWKRSEVLRIG